MPWLINWEYKKSSWWWKYRLWSFRGLIKNVWYCRLPDTVSQLNHYGIRRVSNDCFKSYLSNRNQYVSINGFDPDLATVICDVPQGSLLGSLLFLLYINGLNQAMKFSKVHHFADDTNLLCISNSIKKLNKPVNAELKYLVNCLNTNKMSVNIKKKLRWWS